MDRINFPAFPIIRKDRTHSGDGGILIAVYKNFAFSEINNVKTPDQSVDICGILILNVKIPLDLIICYKTPGITLSQDHWNTTVKNVNKNNNCILVSDFNACNKN